MWVFNFELSFKKFGKFFFIYKIYPKVTHVLWYSFTNVKGFWSPYTSYFTLIQLTNSIQSIYLLNTRVNPLPPNQPLGFTSVGRFFDVVENLQFQVSFIFQKLIHIFININIIVLIFAEIVENWTPNLWKTIYWPAHWITITNT